MQKKSENITPLHIANFLIYCSKQKKVNITPMQLIKLTYIVYCWYYCLFNEKLFEEKIQIWRCGPVIPSLYHEFKVYGGNPITDYGMSAKYSDKGEFEDIEVPALSEDNINVMQLAFDVFEKYKHYSATELCLLMYEEDNSLCYYMFCTCK